MVNRDMLLMLNNHKLVSSKLQVPIASYEQIILLKPI